MIQGQRWVTEVLVRKKSAEKIGVHIPDSGKERKGNLRVRLATTPNPTNPAPRRADIEGSN